MGSVASRWRASRSYPLLRTPRTRGLPRHYLRRLIACLPMRRRCSSAHAVRRRFRTRRSPSCFLAQSHLATTRQRHAGRRSNRWPDDPPGLGRTRMALLTPERGCSRDQCLPVPSVWSSAATDSFGGCLCRAARWHCTVRETLQGCQAFCPFFVRCRACCDYEGA